MLEIQFRVFRGQVEVAKKTVIGPHPVGMKFVFKTDFRHEDSPQEIEILVKQDQARWLHEHQRFEIFHSSMYKTSVWEACGFEKVGDGN